MKITQSPIEFARLPKDYPGLCRLLMPRPIRDEVDLGNVVEMTDAMAGHRLSADQEDYFDLLCRLIEDYDRVEAGVTAPEATGVEVLRHLLEEHGLSGADLSRLLGAHRTLGPMILRGERKLTVGHIRRLCAHFGVSANVFVTG